MGFVGFERPINEKVNMKTVKEIAERTGWPESRVEQMLINVGLAIYDHVETAGANTVFHKITFGHHLYFDLSDGENAFSYIRKHFFKQTAKVLIRDALAAGAKATTKLMGQAHRAKKPFGQFINELQNLVGKQSVLPEKQIVDALRSFYTPDELKERRFTPSSKIVGIYYPAVSENLSDLECSLDQAIIEFQNGDEIELIRFKV